MATLKAIVKSKAAQWPNVRLMGNFKKECIRMGF